MIIGKPLEVFKSVVHFKVEMYLTVYMTNRNSYFNAFLTVVPKSHAVAHQGAEEFTIKVFIIML